VLPVSNKRCASKTGLACSEYSGDARFVKVSATLLFAHSSSDNFVGIASCDSLFVRLGNGEFGRTFQCLGIIRPG
jgi:hypothetical protein